MKRNQTMRLTVAGILVAVAVVGSLFSFPVFGSKCSPVQHMVNVLCGVLLGPWYAFGAGFLAALIRNLLGLGSLLAFPGSMCGSLLCGLIWKFSKKLLPALAGEVFGTGVIGGLLAYPIAVAFMGVSAASVGFYAYVVPFLISTVAGSLIAGAIVFALQKNGALETMTRKLG
ncbi:MAG: energy coupling factor transporter S component ThiW [Clostridia bacterium]|nr:energy coupling factor transporter S component ThiW [Clostridia bacterium]